MVGAAVRRIAPKFVVVLYLNTAFAAAGRPIASALGAVGKLVRFGSLY